MNYLQACQEFKYHHFYIHLRHARGTLTNVPIALSASAKGPFFKLEKEHRTAAAHPLIKEIATAKFEFFKNQEVRLNAELIKEYFDDEGQFCFNSNRLQQVNHPDEIFSGNLNFLFC